MGRCALYSKDKFACLKCPYDKCLKDMDGRTRKAKSIDETVDDILRKKYIRSNQAKDNQKKRSFDYYYLNKERRLEVIKQWEKDNPEVVKKAKRKYMRKQRVLKGTAQIVGAAMIEGKETIIYNGKDDYYFFIGERYGEISKEDYAWVKIKKEVV